VHTRGHAPTQQNIRRHWLVSGNLKVAALSPWLSPLARVKELHLLDHKDPSNLASASADYVCSIRIGWCSGGAMPSGDRDPRHPWRSGDDRIAPRSSAAT